MSHFIQKLIPLEDLKATVMRFPLSVLAALVLFVVCILINHDVLNGDDKDLMRICCVLGCAYFWLGSVKLMSEAQSWPIARHLLYALLGVAALSGIVFVPDLWGMYLIFIVPALLLLIMVAPYTRGGNDLSFWFFNRQMWFGVVVSYIALFMFAGGLSAALLAVHELFSVEIDGEIYGDIWLVASLVLAPIYALSWVPKRFVFAKEDCNDPPGLKFLANWISAPMVFVYLLILYAYFIKIIVTGEVPNGKLAYLISGFIGAGVVTYLISWPLREEGSPQLRLLHKIFFPALFVPTAFHFYAIWERIQAYGFTEQRYYLLISAVWFAFLAIGFTFKKMPIRFIPLVLAVLLLLGGLSAVEVSGRSQFGRLEVLLVKNNLLKDDKIVKAVDEILFEDRKAISSILDYICSTDRDAMIAKWFEFRDYSDKISDNCSGGYNLTEKLGFEYVGYYRQESENEHFTISSYASRHEPINVQGYDYYLRDLNVYGSNGCSGNCKVDNPLDIKARLNKDEAILILERNSLVILEQDLTDLVLKNKGRQNNEEPLFLDLENDAIKARIYFERIYGEMKDGKPKINSTNLDLLYRFKE